MTAGWNMLWGLFEDAVRYQAFVSVFVLIAFLIATNYLQRKALDRATDVMLCCAQEVQHTRVFLDAKRYFDRRSPEAVDNAVRQAAREHGAAEPVIPSGAQTKGTLMLHLLPPLVLIGITLFFSIISYFGAQYPEVADVPSFVLGGGTAIPSGSGSAKIDAAQLQIYESGTLFMVSITFLVSYVRTIARLVERINTNDIRPISYYFLSLNMLTSVLVTIVTRHLLTLLDLSAAGNDISRGAMAGIAFLIGWNPSLWLGELWQKLSEKLKIGFLRARPPTPENLPQDMNLLMIQGLTGDCVDRLAELGIDNCQDLAARNAIVLWLRTPYTLELVCDWIAQAQLCLRYEDDRIKLLRQVGVRDICCYMECLQTPECIDALVGILNTPPPAGAPARPSVSAELLLRQRNAIAINPAYVQLDELHDAMTPKKSPVIA